MSLAPKPPSAVSAGRARGGADAVQHEPRTALDERVARAERRREDVREERARPEHVPREARERGAVREERLVRREQREPAKPTAAAA